MSDYLTNLITRSSTVEPAIRPRLVSLYEPPPGSLPVIHKEVEADGPAPGEADTGDVRAESSDESLPAPPMRRRTQRRQPPRFEQEAEALRERVSAERTAPVTSSEPAPLRVEPATHKSITRPVAETQDVDDQTTPVRQTRLVADGVEIVSEQRAPAMPSSSITPAPPVEQTGVRSVVHSHSEDASQPRIESFMQRQQPATNEQTGPTPDSRASATPIIEVKLATSSPSLHVPEEKRSVKEVTPRETRVEREVTPSDTEPMRTPDRATPPPASIRNLVQPVSVKPAWRASEREHEEAPSEPTIQVTIGRVEVRSVVEETKKSKPRQSQLMSLDEYLRQRAQGAKQ